MDQDFEQVLAENEVLRQQNEQLSEKVAQLVQTVNSLTVRLQTLKVGHHGLVDAITSP